MNIPNIRLFAELGLLHMKNVLLEEELEAARNARPAEPPPQPEPQAAAPEPSPDGIQQ